MNDLPYRDILLNNIVVPVYAQRFLGSHKEPVILPSIEELEKFHDRVVLVVRAGSKEHYDTIVEQIFDLLGNSLCFRSCHYDVMAKKEYFQGRFAVDF